MSALAHISWPNALYVFLACVAWVVALALWSSGWRCARCGSRGPFASFDAEGRPLCFPCAEGRDR